MSNISSTNNITITRGDTFSFKYNINLGTPMDPENYILTENDRLYLGVYAPGQSFENALIRKMYTKDDMIDDYVVIKFKTKDTQYIIPDTYFYDIKLRKNIGTEDEEVTTLVQSRIFWIDGTMPPDYKNIYHMNKYDIIKEQ